MKIFHLTAVLGILAFTSSAAHAQGLMSSLFSFPTANTTTTTCQPGMPCGPNGCVVPRQNPGIVPQGNLNSAGMLSSPYFSNGFGNGGSPYLGSPLSGSNPYGAYGVQRPDYQYSTPMPDVNRGNRPYSSRIPRLFNGNSPSLGDRFNEFLNPRRNNDNLQLQLDRPMFTGVSTGLNRPVNSLPSMSGWNLQ